MHLLPFVTIWDTTLNEAFLKKYFIKKKNKKKGEPERESEGKRRRKKKGLIYFWVNRVTYECVLGTITKLQYTRFLN